MGGIFGETPKLLEIKKRVVIGSVKRQGCIGNTASTANWNSEQDRFWCPDSERSAVGGLMQRSPFGMVETQARMNDVELIIVISPVDLKLEFVIQSSKSVLDV
jgi:hypothetical protein